MCVQGNRFMYFGEEMVAKVTVAMAAKVAVVAKVPEIANQSNY